jgi:hypothetical protein
MYGSYPDFARFREKTFSGPFFVTTATVILDMQKAGSEKPGDIPENERDELTNHSEASRWLRLARAYHRIPILGRLPARAWAFLLAVALAVLLNILFPPGDCTCEDQFTDQKLEAMARQGNQAVQHYLSQKDNPINCAGRRQELLQELEKEKNKGHRKR